MASVANLSVTIGANIKQLESGLQQASKSLNQMGDRLASVGRSLSMSLTLPIVGAGGAMLKFASDAEETQSKFNTVFRDMSDDVRGWAEETARATNRSRFALEGYLATLQDTFVPMGFARGEAAELSKAVTELGIDIASFNNIAEADAIQALTSALVGNVETVRRFGIVITQATLNQELLNMGIQGGVQAANEAQKMQARLNLIMAGSSDAMGDAQRTAGSFANQMRGLQATIQDLAVSMGQELIPIATRLIQFVSNITHRFTALDSVAKRQILLMGAIAGAIGPVLVALGLLAKAIAFIISPIGLTIAAMAALAAAVAYTYDNWGALTERLSDVGWWQNALVRMYQLFLDFNIFGLIIEEFNKLLSVFGAPNIPNPFTMLSDSLEGLKVETREYQHEFGSLGDAIKNSLRDLGTFALESIFGEHTVDTVSDSADAANRFADGIERATVAGANFGRTFANVSVEADKAFKPVFSMGTYMSEILQPAVDTFVNSFGQGMANLVVEGGKFLDVLQNIGKLLASAVIQRAISLFLTGGLETAGTGFFGSGGGLFGSIFGNLFNASPTVSTGITQSAPAPVFDIAIPSVNVPVAPMMSAVDVNPVVASQSGFSEDKLIRALNGISWTLRGDQLFAVTQRGGVRYER